VKNTVADLKRSPGRPRKDRVPFHLKIDSELKAIISLYEDAGIIKRGDVTKHINDELWQWLSPLREVLNSSSAEEGDFFGQDDQIDYEI
jgi:hypothetical protein